MTNSITLFAITWASITAIWIGIYAIWGNLTKLHGKIGCIEGKMNILLKNNHINPGDIDEDDK